MNRIFLSILLLAVTFNSYGQNTIKELFQSVDAAVVELHVKAIAEPKPGQVEYRAATDRSLGSGALITTKGRILTAAHVVGRATEIQVIFSDGTKTSGHVVWVDNLIDLAMIQALKVPKQIKPLSLAKANDYSVGERVMVIGAPLGVSHSLSVGYLSGIRDKEEIPGTNMTPRFLQTDASINQGNSGGPMFNMQGEILGIVSHILSKSGGSDGLGFAISTDTIRKAMSSEPSVFTGVIPYLLTEKQAKAINNPYGYGVLIQQVIPGTVAHKMGFKGGNLNVIIGQTPVLLGGDIILEVGGRPLRDLKTAMEVKARFREYDKGDKIVVTYLRDGQVEKTYWVKD